MRQTDISDKLAVRLLPRVRILVSSSNPEVIKSAESQAYPKKTIAINKDGLPTPVFYNNEIELKQHDTDLLVFLNDIFWFASEDSLTRIVEKYVENEFKTPIIYSDVAQTDGVHITHQYLPYFSAKDFVQNSMAPNTGFTIESKILSPRPFDERLTGLYFFAFLNGAASRCLMQHIPEPLYLMSNVNQDVQQDIAILQNGQAR